MSRELSPLPPPRYCGHHPRLWLARIAFEHRQSRAAYWESGDDMPYDSWLALQASQNGRWRALAENSTGWSRPAKVDPTRSRESVRRALSYRNKERRTRLDAAADPKRLPAGEKFRRAEFAEFMGDERQLQRCYDPATTNATYAANVRAGTSGEFTSIPYSRWRMWERRWLQPLRQEELDGIQFYTFQLREGEH